MAIGCKNLKRMYLRDVMVTGEGLKDVFHEFDQIEKLTLDGYANLTEDVIREHASMTCKNLQELKMPNCGTNEDILFVIPA